MAAPVQAPKEKSIIVKQVLSGDQIEGFDSTPEKTKIFIFSNISAPKLGKLAHGNFQQTQDEPYAWEARELLRRRLVGEKVNFVSDNDGEGDREYGTIIHGEENITELLVREGLAKVREGQSKARESRQNELLRLQEEAKTKKKNIWSEGAEKNVRDIKGSPENMIAFVEKNNKKPIKAIIEHVFYGSSFRALLLPDFYHINLMLTGIRCPIIKKGEEATDEAKEAKTLVEKCLLQRDIEVILESQEKNAFYGTVLHPKGNITEVLLRAGLAHCVDWSMGALKSGAAELRAAEKYAKDKKLKLWKNHEPAPQTHIGNSREFTGTVVEVVNGDALMIKTGSGPAEKYFLSSIRSPKETPKTGDETAPPTKKQPTRTLYDIPWLFEAREFLRKKLIGKKVNVIIDYKQPASDRYKEKICCTVKIGGVNVAEALVSKGLASVVRHGQNTDDRSSHYDALNAADDKARKSGKGIHAKKDVPQHRVSVVADKARAQSFLQSFQRGRFEALVEYVSSGSRLRLYIPKESCLITFLLAGISCARTGPRPGTGLSEKLSKKDMYGEVALQFTRDRVMQREVEISVEGIDKTGNFIGWLFIEGINLSVALVEEGLADVHGSAEKSQYFRTLKTAEDVAKARRANIWKDYVEEEKKEEKVEDDTPERKIDYQTVVVTEVTQDLKFYVQNVEQGPKLETLSSKIREEFQSSPPLPGAYTPRKGDLCAAKFADDEWYRARVERVQGSQVHVFYIDYGNREITSSVRCASLPPAFTQEKPYANEFTLAFVKLNSDADDRDSAIKAFRDDVVGKTLLLNVEYRIEKTVYATLTTPDTKVDIGKGLVLDALLMVDFRSEKRLQKIMTEYRHAQDEAKNAHRGIWMYGDITEDDAKEFGR